MGEHEASAHGLTDEQRDTHQDPQVEVTHPDAFARKQHEADTPDPDTIRGGGNNPAEEQGGVGEKTEDMELDPSQAGDSSKGEEE